MRVALFALFLAACPGGSDSDSDSDTDSDTDPSGATFLLTALMADNVAHSTDEAGDFDDWVEITNTGDATASLAGWVLTDGFPDEVGWTFPDGTDVAAGDTVRVWCDEDPVDGLHADFKLAAAGETLTLVDPDGEAVDEVTWTNLGEDEVYARGDNGEWAVE